MKIVHILTRLLRAGSEENTIATCRAQIADGHEVYLMHGKEFDQRHYLNPVPGLTLVKIDSLVHPISPVADVRAVLEMRNWMKKVMPSVVHTHQSKAGILGRMAAHLTSVPTIIHGVHIVPFENVGTVQRLVYLAAEKLMARITDGFVNVSKGTRDIYIKNGIGHESLHHVVHSGFDLSRFKGAIPPDDWREILGIGQDEEKPPVIVMLAALEERKRHCEFLRVFVDIVKEMPNVRLLMPGEGPHRPMVEKTIDELGLHENAKLLGFRTDPEKLIAMADVGVLVSTREGLPRVIMQYLAGGKPVVATDLPGLDEVLQNNRNGIVVRPDHVMGATSSILALLKNKQELHRLSVGAHETDLSSWDVKMMGVKMRHAYSACLSGKIRG